MNNNKNKLGQVWIETVIYTLIGLFMIGLVLYYARPKIEDMQDESVLKQSTQMLEKIDSTILTIGPPGSQRTVKVWIKKGQLTLDGVANKIMFDMESKNYFSEEGKNVSLGRINASTSKQNEINFVKLVLNYNTTNGYNITISEADKIKTLNKASTPYEFLIINKGRDGSDRVWIDISLD